LISASWERNPDLRIFSINRALRIFPALWAIVVASGISLIFLFGPEVLKAHSLSMLAWILCQATLFQQWNPEFLHDYGVGVMNGSLWTISVELCFYVLIPILYIWTKSAVRLRFLLWLTIFASFAVQIVFHTDWIDGMPPILTKLAEVSFVPWVGLFCLGVVAQRSIDRIYPIVENRALVFMLAFVTLSVFTHHFPLYRILGGRSNALGVVNYILMCATIVSIADSWRGLADRLLRRNHVSYGIYVIHMPVINAYLALGWTGITAFGAAIATIVVLATISWFVIEKPELRLKPRSRYQHG
jgi:peptidoglycan/LPS O-acetylase OafA/YrhL